jgi:hypothetical protein
MGGIRRRKERQRMFERWAKEKKKLKKPNVHGVTKIIDQGEKTRQASSCATVIDSKKVE